MILEDDIDLDDTLADVLRALGKLPASWEMIRLAGLRERQSQSLCQLTPQHTVERLLNTAGGTQGYALTPHGASKLLAAARPIIRPIDIMVDRYWHNGVDILAVQPYVVRARLDIPSDTQRPPPRRHQVVWDWSRVRFFRGARKLKDSLCKRITNQWRCFRCVYEFEQSG